MVCYGGYSLNKTSVKGKVIKVLINTFAKLPLSWTQALGRFIGRLIWWLNLKSAKDCRTNLTHCFPDMDPKERQELAKQSIINTGMTAAEWGAIWSWPTTKVLGLITSIEGEEYIRKNREEKNQGLLMLTPHLGNWELGAPYLAEKFSLSILYQPPKIVELDSFVTESRSRNGAELVPTNKRGVIRLFQILREGGVVGILPDQEPEISGGIFAPFFGIPANTIKLVSKLIEKTNPKVLTLCPLRLPDGKGFKLIIREADPAIYDKNLLTSVTALNRTVEQCVLEAPEQYQWVYKRFKRRPSGKRHFYD